MGLALGVSPHKVERLSGPWPAGRLVIVQVGRSPRGQEADLAQMTGTMAAESHACTVLLHWLQQERPKVVELLRNHSLQHVTQASAWLPARCA
jgi:hypothetical protein